MLKRIYEDDNWIIEKNNKGIRISHFKDGHFTDDLDLRENYFISNVIENIKNIVQEFSEYGIN